MPASEQEKDTILCDARRDLDSMAPFPSDVMWPALDVVQDYPAALDWRFTVALMVLGFGALFWH